jgi:hypothetical protein
MTIKQFTNKVGLILLFTSVLVLIFTFIVYADPSFSIPSLSPTWNGDGVISYMDYVNNGIEHIDVTDLSLNVLIPIYSVKGRGGMDINLSLSNSSKAAQFTFNLSSWGSWGLSGITAISDGILFLPDGTSYRINDDGVYGDIYLQADDNTGTRYTLSNGLSIQISSDGSYETVADMNGNWIEYTFGYLQTGSYQYLKRIQSIIDSIGHQINFVWGDDNNLSGICQVLKDNSKKMILNVNYGPNSIKFTDAVGRTTQFNYSTISIDYP